MEFNTNIQADWSCIFIWIPNLELIQTMIVEKNWTDEFSIFDKTMQNNRKQGDITWFLWRNKLASSPRFKDVKKILWQSAFELLKNKIDWDKPIFIGQTI